MKKIGIIYMCTGNYKIFWEEFYKTSETFFLKKTEKHYFVFTDADTIDNENLDKKIHKIFLENKKWPYITLLRYDTIMKNKKLFDEMDYLFFFNANIKFLKEVKEEEILPQKEELMVVLLRKAGKENIDDYFEKNKKSTAYVFPGEGENYVSGALNGGLRESYLKMAETCNLNIQNDLKRGVIAAWHDEAHLNRYIIDNPKIRLLDRKIFLAGPDILKEDSKIALLNKNDFYRYGQAFLRSNKSVVDDPRYRENLIVYGTGKMAEEWYEKFKDKVTIKCFVCTNPTIKEFHGIEVRKADREVIKQGVVILALVNGYSHAYALLQECGLEEYKDFWKSTEYVL